MNMWQKMWFFLRNEVAKKDLLKLQPLRKVIQ
jgi:hypothetical protein